MYVRNWILCFIELCRSFPFFLFSSPWSKAMWDFAIIWCTLSVIRRKLFISKHFLHESIIPKLYRNWLGWTLRGPLSRCWLLLKIHICFIVHCWFIVYQNVAYSNSNCSCSATGNATCILFISSMIFFYQLNDADYAYFVLKESQ